MHPNKKKVLVAASMALGLALAGCANTEGGGEDTGADRVDLPVIESIDTPADAILPAGDGNATCPDTTTLTYIGAQTGPNAQLGINIYNGVQQAIDEHNAANPNCQVQFVKRDTEGSPDRAPGPVTQTVNDTNVVGVIGLPFSGESRATGQIFNQAGLVHITPAATGPNLSQNGWKTFFRGLGNDSVQGPAAATMITEMLQAQTVYVVQDDTEYGIGLAATTTEALGDAVVGSDRITTGQRDFAATVSQIVSAAPDAVFISGYFAEGAPLVQQLVQRGYEGQIVAPDGIKDNEFVRQAGDSSEGVYFTCPCIPGELIPTFAEGYKQVSGGADPGTYSIEGYDAATVLLSGIDAGNQDRASLLEWVRTYDKPGLSKHYKWDETGELQAPDVFGYKVQDGAILPVGKIEQ